MGRRVNFFQRQFNCLRGAKMTRADGCAEDEDLLGHGRHYSRRFERDAIVPFRLRNRGYR